MKKKFFWVVLVIFTLAFITSHFLSQKGELPEVCEKSKPIVPHAISIENDPLTLLPVNRESHSAHQFFEPLLSHPWIQMQPAVNQLNIEMIRDLCALEEFCERLGKEEGLSPKQIEEMAICTLIKLQEEIPFKFPESLYNVIFITESPEYTVKPPGLFHVYKRLYLDDSEMGIPFYLDVRVFQSEKVSLDEVINWHLQILDGEPEVLYQSDNRIVFKKMGCRERETAHGFARGKRGLYADFLQSGDKLYVLYAETSLKTFYKNETLFNQLVKYEYD